MHKALSCLHASLLLGRSSSYRHSPPKLPACNINPKLYPLHSPPQQSSHLRTLTCLRLSLLPEHLRNLPSQARTAFCSLCIAWVSIHTKGYRCLDLLTRRVIISRHVVFDEIVFPFSFRNDEDKSLDFLLLSQQHVPPTVPITGTAASTRPRGIHSTTTRTIITDADAAGLHCRASAGLCLQRPSGQRP